eukprot:1141273-Pelagomonas_calceolata.AAC.8
MSWVQTLFAVQTQGLTKSADYASVFVNTGILDALTLQLYSECGSNPPANSRAQSPSQQQGGSPKEVSHGGRQRQQLCWKLGKCTWKHWIQLQVGFAHLHVLEQCHNRGCSRRVIGTRRKERVLRYASQQKMAAFCLGKGGPAIGITWHGDEEAIPSLCDLVLDCSVDIAARLSAAALIAATVSLRTDDSAELSLRKGAFTALMFVMDSDHRQVMGCVIGHRSEIPHVAMQGSFHGPHLCDGLRPQTRAGISD